MDTLTLLSGLTKGLEGFAKASEYSGAASGYENSAGLLDVQAQSIISSGDYTARRQREQGDRFLANQVARYAKAGVKFSGSPALVWAESERNIRLDILATKLNAANQANQVGFAALNQRLLAGQQRSRAATAKMQGILNFSQSLLTAGLSGVKTSITPTAKENTAGMSLINRY